MNGNFYLIMLAVAALVLLRAVRNMHRPVKGNGFRIILPLFFILPGLEYILQPAAQAPDWMILSAVALGAVLSLPLILTTGYEVRADGKVYAKMSYWFVVAFLGMLAVRFGLRAELHTLDPQVKTSLFMIVAFCYIIPWRIASYIKYRRAARGAAGRMVEA